MLHGLPQMLPVDKVNGRHWDDQNGYNVIHVHLNDKRKRATKALIASVKRTRRKENEGVYHGINVFPIYKRVDGRQQKGNVAHDGEHVE